MSGTDSVDQFVRMARTVPGRTGLFTFGPVLFALLQVSNSYVSGHSVVPALCLLGVMVAYSWLVTHYHLASFRREQLVAAHVSHSGSA